ncbi:MAG TPA: hypothetical protein VE998_08410 [Terriglobales bacterium]|nr:hypothetical protein [Terriglobales bacterium]
MTVPFLKWPKGKYGLETANFLNALVSQPNYCSLPLAEPPCLSETAFAGYRADHDPNVAVHLEAAVHLETYLLIQRETTPSAPEVRMTRNAPQTDK